MKQTMTDEQFTKVYVNMECQHCPNCGGSDLEKQDEGWESLGNIWTIDWGCLSCKTVWRDSFEYKSSEQM